MRRNRQTLFVMHYVPRGVAEKITIFALGFVTTVFVFFSHRSSLFFPPPYFASHYKINGSQQHLIPLKKLDEFVYYLNQPLVPCTNKKTFGGNLHDGYLDGQKTLCLDPSMGFTNQGCIVLSFGINNEWSFDDAVAEAGCHVYAFDPTMDVEEHDRSKNIHFLNIGISNFQGEVTIKEKKAKVDRYENLLRRLGILNSNISVLKMDVEGSELAFFDDVFRSSPALLTKVKQMAIEIHPLQYEGDGIDPGGRFELFWKYFQLLEHYGFQLMLSEPNKVSSTHYKWNGHTLAGGYELVFVNTGIGESQS